MLNIIDGRNAELTIKDNKFTVGGYDASSSSRYTYIISDSEGKELLRVSTDELSKAALAYAVNIFLYGHMQLKGKKYDLIDKDELMDDLRDAILLEDFDNLMCIDYTKADVDLSPRVYTGAKFYIHNYIDGHFVVEHEPSQDSGFEDYYDIVIYKYSCRILTSDERLSEGRMFGKLFDKDEIYHKRVDKNNYSTKEVIEKCVRDILRTYKRSEG